MLPRYILLLCLCVAVYTTSVQARAQPAQDVDIPKPGPGEEEVEIIVEGGALGSVIKLSKPWDPARSDRRRHVHLKTRRMLVNIVYICGDNFSDYIPSDRSTQSRVSRCSARKKYTIFLPDDLECSMNSICLYGVPGTHSRAAPANWYSCSSCPATILYCSVCRAPLCTRTPSHCAAPSPAAQLHSRLVFMSTAESRQQCCKCINLQHNVHNLCRTAALRARELKTEREYKISGEYKAKRVQREIGTLRMFAERSGKRLGLKRGSSCSEIKFVRTCSSSACTAARTSRYTASRKPKLSFAGARASTRCRSQIWITHIYCVYCVTARASEAPAAAAAAAASASHLNYL
ncbi:unnamed protein product [Trichogramma brassicae]|uniref:Uncharacterized protein n=1 Tax=Trichogramma brassicae TaxID=86971 RepID=A0A6H5ISV5_9HYME|nr:unnamed protein product [Trichogramma brassicae]